jgi:hypothetical protein
MTSSTVNPHASESGGTCRELSQEIGWRESQALPITVKPDGPLLIKVFAKELLTDSERLLIR